MIAEENMWYPGPDYQGRKGDYALLAGHLNDDVLVGMVQVRVEEDGLWAIENGQVGGKVELMGKMMEWAGHPDNIVQCAKANLDKGVTVDWICYELATAAKAIGAGRG